MRRPNEVIENIKDFIKLDQHYYDNELSTEECIEIIDYIEQLEKELENYKLKSQIKQTVARTYPVGLSTTGNLEEKLNQGYHVVMANHIGTNNSIEYILEKEAIQDGEA